eukprot:11956390-Prorocentrum_lima.AAC.1
MGPEGKTTTNPGKGGARREIRILCIRMLLRRSSNAGSHPQPASACFSGGEEQSQARQHQARHPQG